MPRIDFDAFEDEWEDDDERPPRRGRELSPAARARINELGSARVVAVDRGRVSVLFDGEVVDATLAGTMRGTKTVVGDHVRVRAPRHEQDLPRIVEVLDRETVLTRTGDDTEDDERILVANADQVVVVLAADHLDTGVRFLDRVMVSASVGGLETAVCVNRIDLVDDRGAVSSVMDRYQRLGVTWLVTSAKTGEGIDDLIALLSLQWSAFAGHSGVGKSSLFNLVVPEAEREVGEIGPRGGRHTTTASIAMHVRAIDAWLVDTPGVRSFGLGALEPRQLARHFPELAALTCAHDDCIHDGEPGCRLAEAQIHPDRLASYRRLLASLRGQP
jgi:ribosome biogenesis GTPase / thiamine phosphate phosphatase